VVVRAGVGVHEAVGAIENASIRKRSCTRLDGG
jgi:hypothetical protein